MQTPDYFKECSFDNKNSNKLSKDKNKRARSIFGQGVEKPKL